jgi:hypothetical protein
MAVLADVPPLLPIQGYLTDKQGAPVDGSKSVAFRLYTAPTAGTPMHEETIQTVVVDGYFTAYLGDDSQRPLDLGKLRDSQKVFLGIEVENDGEGLPRLQIASTAFAAQAAFCGDASNFGGKAPSAFAVASHTHDWTDLTGKPATFPPTAHSHGDADIACYADLGAEGYLDNNAPGDLLMQGQADGRYANKNHPHDAGDIQSGLLNDQRFSAYADLNAEGYLDNNAGGDLIVLGQGDMRYVNVGEPNSIGSPMIGDGSIQAADLSPTAVQMDKTTAPIGASTNSQTLLGSGITSYIMSGMPVAADSAGTCILTATVRVGSSGQTGYFYTYPAYTRDGGAPSGIGGTTISYGMLSAANIAFQTSTITGMLGVSAGSVYQFGCVVYISSGSTFSGNGFTCNTSWICN